VEQHGHPAVRHARARRPPEDLLQPDGQHRLLTGVVVDGDGRAARDGQPLGGQLVEPGRCRPGQQPAQRRGGVDVPQVAAATHPGEVGAEPGRHAVQQGVVADVGPGLAHRAVQKREAAAQ